MLYRLFSKILDMFRWPTGLVEGWIILSKPPNSMLIKIIVIIVFIESITIAVA
jgi:hypothetical protein